jgi:Glycosyltransferase 61
MALSEQASLPLRKAPYARLIKRLMWGQGTLESASFGREILCPEETRDTQPAVFLAGQIDRITGSTEHQPIQAEIASMVAPTYRHAATIAYHIREAVIFDGSIYAGSLRHFIADKELFTSRDQGRHLRVAGFASSTVGARYFGHWLRDDCIQYLLADRYGSSVCVSSGIFNHKPKYANYFRQDWTPTDRALIDELVVFQDYSQNSLKRARYEILASRVRAEFPQDHRHALVYLRRGRTGAQRVIQEEAALIDELVKNGFVVVDVFDDLDEILKTLARAKLVVSIEGSHISHSCYSLAKGCGLLVLQPPDRFTAVHRHWTDCVGITFGFVVGVSGETGYRFKVSEILGTIDQMLKNTQSVI